MHPYVLAELSDPRLEDYHRRAEQARRVAAARRADRVIHRVGPLRARTGGLLVALGTMVAGTRTSAPRLRGAR
jgi:hypothetical protein